MRYFWICMIRRILINHFILLNGLFSSSGLVGVCPRDPLCSFHKCARINPRAHLFTWRYGCASCKRNFCYMQVLSSIAMPTTLSSPLGNPLPRRVCTSLCGWGCGHCEVADTPDLPNTLRKTVGGGMLFSSVTNLVFVQVGNLICFSPASSNQRVFIWQLRGKTLYN